MMRTSKSLSARIVAFLAALCMAMALVPAAAFAEIQPVEDPQVPIQSEEEDETYTISAEQSLTTSSVSIAQGESLDLKTLLAAASGASTTDPVFTVLDSNGTDVTSTYGTISWHRDYVVTSGGSTVSVNKHSGMLTANTLPDGVTSANATVTIYIMEGTTPTNNPGKPCNGLEQYGAFPVTITVTDSSNYTYQGANMTIMMTSPAVTSFGGNNTSGWLNTLAAQTPANGYYNFTVKLSNGFQSHNTPSAFAIINAGNVKVKTPLGVELGFLNANNDGNVIIDSVDHSTKTVNIKVASSIVTPNSSRLVFETGFRGNNANNTLGTTVAFVIK